MRSMNISAMYRFMAYTLVAGGFWMTVSGMFESNRVEAQTVGQEEVQAFAKANVKVAKIQTASAEKSGNEVIDLNIPVDKLPEEKKIPTIQAIEAQGLTVAEYNELLEAYKTNEDFRNQVVRALLNLHPDPSDAGK